MLEWMGREKVVNHHHDVPFLVLERKWRFDGGKESHAEGAEGAERASTTESETATTPRSPRENENMIIHGDNLVVLKSLLPRCEGRIKCIYIDPPYNTGNEGWVYNDNVNKRVK